MKVNIDPPQWAQDLMEEECLLCVAYDVTEACTGGEGYAAITKEFLYILADGSCIHKIPLSSVRELKAQWMVGSGRLLCRTDERILILCHCTQRICSHLAEFAQVVQYYLKTGNLSDLEVEVWVCPKCGHPFMWGTKVCPRCVNKSTAFKRIFEMCKTYKWQIVAIAGFTMLIELFYIIIPYFQRVMVDGYITPQKSEWMGLIFWGCAGAVMNLVIMGLEVVCTKMKNRLALTVSKDLRQMLFNKIQFLSSTSLSKHSAGDLMHRLSYDTAAVQQFMSEQGTEVIVRVFSFLVLMVIMLWTQPMLTLLIILPFPFVFLVVSLINNKINRLFNQNWTVGNRANTVLHDILNGIRVVKSYGSEKREIDRYTRYSKRNADSLTQAEIFWAKLFPFVNFFIRSGLYLALYFGAKAVLGNTMELGELMQYITYVNMLYTPLYWIIYLPRQLTRTAVSASKMFELLDEPDEIEAPKEGQLQIVGDVEFDHVSFGYKPYTPVLQDISFKVHPGEVIGIVGASGVGKSTLINLIMRLYDVRSGAIRVDGQDLKDIDKSLFRSQLGVVLQETFLFDDSILANIRYAQPDADFTEVIRAAKVANAHQFISRLPDGYNTRVGDRGYMLSGGERQRIAIARAILHNPRILILDEATASLDTETEKLIQDALDKLTKGRTTFIIAHRLSTLRNADRLIVLDKGKLSEFGTHMELMQHQGVYYNLVMAQRQTAKIRK
ncbi:MAG TPA: ABC transporter ATP-binding protein/permease [Firmicutes bacterium]|nr:ABC transporter ATP-binding protein/permease [Bacillota bacterium]